MKVTSYNSAIAHENMKRTNSFTEVIETKVNKKEFKIRSYLFLIKV